MGILYLLMLAVFVPALGYFTLLVAAEVLHGAQRRVAGGPRAEHPIMRHLTQMTQEFSAIIGLGDD